MKTLLTRSEREKLKVRKTFSGEHECEGAFEASIFTTLSNLQPISNLGFRVFRVKLLSILGFRFFSNYFMFYVLGLFVFQFQVLVFMRSSILSFFKGFWVILIFCPLSSYNFIRHRQKWKITFICLFIMVVHFWIIN